MLSDNAKQKIDAILTKYPTKKAALLPALWVAQEDNDGWVPREAMKDIAEYLDLPPPMWKAWRHSTRCTTKPPSASTMSKSATTSSAWRSARTHLIDHLGEKLGIDKGETTPDRKFTLNGAECLGACANAPCMMVGDTYYEDLTLTKPTRLLTIWRAK